MTESRDSGGSLSGKDSKDYRIFKTLLSTMAKGIGAKNLTILATELFSLKLVTSSEHSDAINGTDLVLNTTNLLRSVLTLIETDPFSDTKESCYMKFVRALRASDLSQIADLLASDDSKAQASDSVTSVTSGVGSLSLSGQSLDGSPANDSNIHSEISHKATGDKFISGHYPRINTDHYKSQRLPTSSQQCVHHRTQLPSVPYSAPDLGNMCDMCDIHETEASHYKKVVNNRDDEKDSFGNVLDHYKTKCKQQMSEINRLESEIKQLKEEKFQMQQEVSHSRQKYEAHLTNLSHKLRAVKEVCVQYKELVSTGAKENKINDELLQLFESIKHPFT